MVLCGVYGCSNRSNRLSLYNKSFYSIPKVIYHQGKKTRLLSERRRVEWLNRLNLISDFDDAKFRICAAHFVSGKPSALYDSRNPDWVPSLYLNLEDSTMPESDARYISGEYPVEASYEEEPTNNSEDGAWANEAMAEGEQHEAINLEGDGEEFGPGRCTDENVNTVWKSSMCCSILGCHSRTVLGQISLHRFPTCPSVRRRWKKRLGLTGQEITRRMCICSKHFKDTDYVPVLPGYTPLRRRLKKNAVPSKNLPNFPFENRTEDDDGEEVPPDDKKCIVVTQFSSTMTELYVTLIENTYC